MPLFSSSLPPYRGPYAVSTTNVELPVPRASFGTALLAATHERALNLETVLFTLYYPATVGPKCKHQDWVERPLARTAAGYARFVNKSKYLITPVFWLLAGSTQLPAALDAPLADGARSESPVEKSDDNTSASSSGTLVTKSDQAFPFILFSHGLSGSRTTYSQYCGELASNGNVVLAIEHRDGSGPITIVRSPDKTEKIIDYIKPDELIYDAPNPTLSPIEFRKEQLVMREAEIVAALSIVERLNAGEGDAISRDNLRGDNGEARLGDWKGRLDLKRMYLAGHSFGGATGLQVLRTGTSPFSKGLFLDPWIDPIPPYSSDQTISVPLLIINSEIFTLWNTSFQSVKLILTGVTSTTQKFLLTLVGSVHLSFSDFPIIQPYLSRKSGSRIDPIEAMNIFVDTSLEFISPQVGTGKILGVKVKVEDRDGRRVGEGYKREGLAPMETVGDIRVHVSSVN